MPLNLLCFTSGNGKKSQIAQIIKIKSPETLMKTSKQNDDQFTFIKYNLPDTKSKTTMEPTKARIRKESL